MDRCTASRLDAESCLEPRLAACSYATSSRRLTFPVSTARQWTGMRCAENTSGASDYNPALAVIGQVLLALAFPERVAAGDVRIMTGARCPTASCRHSRGVRHHPPAGSRSSTGRSGSTWRGSVRRRAGTSVLVSGRLYSCTRTRGLSLLSAGRTSRWSGNLA